MREKMTKPPKTMTLCNLEVLVMPNGEVLCLGFSHGFIGKLGKALTAKEGDERPSND